MQKKTLSIPVPLRQIWLTVHQKRRTPCSLVRICLHELGSTYLALTTRSDPRLRNNFFHQKNHQRQQTHSKNCFKTPGCCTSPIDNNSLRTPAQSERAINEDDCPLACLCNVTTLPLVVVQRCICPDVVFPETVSQIRYFKPTLPTRTCPSALQEIDNLLSHKNLEETFRDRRVGHVRHQLTVQRAKTTQGSSTFQTEVAPGMSHRSQMFDRTAEQSNTVRRCSIGQPSTQTLGIRSSIGLPGTHAPWLVLADRNTSRS